MLKKIIAIIMTVCLVASVFCVSASAAESSVLRVSGMKTDGSLATIKDYDTFETGWDEAMEYADDEDFMEDNGYDRIVIDFYADWTANSKGEFGSSRLLGFQYSTIYVPDDARITVNLNGNTINRGLTEREYDGEVIYIDDDADVIINDGTVTGGNSRNGAGGIHITDDAAVTLNNVNIVGNIADNDDGGGIALYNGAQLTMNGGIFDYNMVDGNNFLCCYGGAVYVKDAKASFHGVSFRNNHTTSYTDYGAAIYANNSNVYIEDCTFDGNGKRLPDVKGTAVSTIHCDMSVVTISGSTFINNGAYYRLVSASFFSSIITLEYSRLTIEKDCTFRNNTALSLIYAHTTSYIYASDSTFTDNASVVMYSYDNHDDDSYFKNCTFNNNKLPTPNSLYADGYQPCAFDIRYKALSFYDCDMGDSTYSDEKCINLVDSNSNHVLASIFGEGSLTMIVALLALIAAVVAICLTVVQNKKKPAPVTADSAEEPKSKE